MSTKSTTKKPIVEPKNPEYLPANVIKDAGDLPTKVAKFTVIKTDAQLKEADQIDCALADMIKLIKSDMKPLKEAAYKAHKVITKYETDKLTPLKAARAVISRLVSACYAEREQIADEKARLESIANAKLARETAEKDREARIEVLIAEGKEDEVEELITEELIVENTAMVRPDPLIPAGLGMHSVSRWVGEVTDLKALFKAVVDGVVPMGTVDMPGPLMVNQPYLNKLASAQKATMMMPGVTAKDVGGTSR